MPGVPGIPPGRAGRNWLRRRLGTAERGRAQLDRKLRVLIPERQRLGLGADRNHEEWVSACEEARTWLLRAVLLSGEDGIRLGAPGEPVSVDVRWATSMGLRFPVDARVASPAEGDAIWANAASAPAAAAFRAAVEAGARSAAADEAVRRMDAEIAVTRRRLRALEKRWLPRLQDSLRDLELELEQAEQEDNIRLRQAARTMADRSTTDRRSPP